MSLENLLPNPQPETHINCLDSNKVADWIPIINDEGIH